MWPKSTGSAWCKNGRRYSLGGRLILPPRTACRAPTQRCMRLLIGPRFCLILTHKKKDALCCACPSKKAPLVLPTAVRRLHVERMAGHDRRIDG